MSDASKTALRWVLLLPGMLLAVLAANVLLHLIIAGTLNSESMQMEQASRDRIERILLPFFAAAALLLAGWFIAPSHKIVVGASLAFVLAAAWSVYFFGFFSS